MWLVVGAVFQGAATAYPLPVAQSGEAPTANTPLGYGLRQSGQDGQALLQDFGSPLEMDTPWPLSPDDDDVAGRRRLSPLEVGSGAVVDSVSRDGLPSDSDVTLSGSPSSGIDSARNPGPPAPVSKPRSRRHQSESPSDSETVTDRWRPTGSAEAAPDVESDFEAHPDDDSHDTDLGHWQGRASGRRPVDCNVTLVHDPLAAAELVRGWGRCWLALDGSLLPLLVVSICNASTGGANSMPRAASIGRGKHTVSETNRSFRGIVEEATATGSGTGLAMVLALVGHRDGSRHNLKSGCSEPLARLSVYTGVARVSMNGGEPGERQNVTVTALVMVSGVCEEQSRMLSASMYHRLVWVPLGASGDSDSGPQLAWYLPSRGRWRSQAGTACRVPISSAYLPTYLLLWYLFCVWGLGNSYKHIFEDQPASGCVFRFGAASGRAGTTCGEQGRPRL